MVFSGDCVARMMAISLKATTNNLGCLVYVYEIIVSHDNSNGLGLFRSFSGFLLGTHAMEKEWRLAAPAKYS